MFDCFWLSVPVQLIAWKDSSPNDLLCVEWDVKPYTLTHSVEGSDCLFQTHKSCLFQKRRYSLQQLKNDLRSTISTVVLSASRHSRSITNRARARDLLTKKDSAHKGTTLTGGVIKLPSPRMRETCRAPLRRRKISLRHQVEVIRNGD